MLHLRKATPDDLATLRRWNDQSHLIATIGPAADWNWTYELARTPDWRELLIAELDGTPIGFVQLIDPHREETHYWGDVGPHKRAIDIWIGEAARLGKGYGTQMMQLALAQCFADPLVREVLVDPRLTNEGAQRFYRRLGFRFVAERTLGGDRCAVYGLSRAAWEKQQPPPPP
jgi:aminoglycoside 6'-N-acetyltransferase